MKRIALNIACGLFALMFINAGLNKFFNYIPMPDDIPEKALQAIDGFNKIPWLMPLVGFVEILGAILIAIPKTRALGAIVVFPLIVGILCHNIYVDISGLLIALPFFIVNLWVLWENREKYLPMIS
ncbi:MAG: DoxX family protein [Chitinophagales bacterium]|nr:DoxX family protein [Chitinophagales bacterium]